MLASPKFVFRVERDPADVAAGQRLSNQRSRARVAVVVLPVEQHPRRRAARGGAAGQAARCRPVLERQVRRMLADPRVAGARHQFRRPVAVPPQPARTTIPNSNEFPDFDDNLRQAFQRETELFFDSIMREDRNVLDLHDGRLHVRQRAAGPALRVPERLRQPVPPRDASPTRRGKGCSGKGSILMVTSHADRTSPVVRGKWMLDNLLGAPPPPPPAERAAAQRKSDARRQGRTRCASAWRSTAPNPACATCHKIMDPIGFALENFDAVGAWRTRDGGSSAADRCVGSAHRRHEGGRRGRRCGRRC